MTDTMSNSSRQPNSTKMAAGSEKRSGEYHVTFKAVPPAGLLGNLGPFLNADITNPRELYSMLSESKQGGLLASLSVKPQAGSKLPPLHSSSEVGFGRSLGSQTKYGSYPDLLKGHPQPSYPQQHSTAINGAKTSSVRRSTSLQDVSTAGKSEFGRGSKLKPILKASEVQENNYGGGGGGGTSNGAMGGVVKFKDTRLTKDRPLPPIEGVGGQPSGNGTLTFITAGNHANGHANHANTSGHRGNTNGIHSNSVNESEGHNNTPYPSLATATSSAKLQLLGSGEVSLNHSPRHFHPNNHHHHHAHYSVISPAELENFPRGQAMTVKKPSTPTFDSYPEAYWELRSPTVQDPSDLKEDMIDRDRYRLQQISTLRLRAINRDAVPNRLDMYRKWQQQQLQQLQQQQQQYSDSPRANATSVTAAASNGSATAAAARQPAGRQQRMLLPIRNQGLGVTATSISPSAHSPTKKRPVNVNGKTNLDRSEEQTDSQQQQQEEQQTNWNTTDDEQHRRNKIEATARAAACNGEGGGGEGKDGRRLRTAVVNLCIDPDRRSLQSTSDVYNGIRQVMLRPRPMSDKSKSRQGQGQDLQGQTELIVPGSVSNASHMATVGSSYSILRPRIPSAPVGTPPTNGADVTEGTGGGGGGSGSDAGGKLLLKKFNRLEVFGERSAARAEYLQPSIPDTNNVSFQTTDVSLVPVVKVNDKNHPYMPQNRPPTYRMDTKYYQSRILGGPALAEAGNGGEGGLVGIREGGGGQGLPYPSGYNDRNSTAPSFLARSPDFRSEATSLSFRFHNGEVIVSRQGKRPSANPPATTASGDHVSQAGQLDNGNVTYYVQ